MAAGTSPEQNLNYAIASLKGIKESVSLLEGMFSAIKKWSHVTDSLKNETDNALYELTGDNFYKPEKGERKRQ